MKLNLGLLILRVSVGLIMFLQHGLPKLSKFTVLSSSFPDIMGIGSQVSLSLAVFSEFFCSIFLIAGLLTRWAAIPLICTMLVAILVVHGNDPFKVKELAVMYLVSYIVILITGPGEYAVDKFLKKS
ncbi:hypothetical protein A9Q84_17515 [Halobacteriovorax marinus]|uniref:DoxX family protein n=1 Tax=Halobacteriovorax marinus TaxID=97084 RepID=A0A1Y5F712_9BACT|nr:hypothetical protein A9Q84_17515 [Halobacteriovorax marinus]